jgi:hypothetical protein
LQSELFVQEFQDIPNPLAAPSAYIAHLEHVSLYDGQMLQDTVVQGLHKRVIVGVQITLKLFIRFSAHFRVQELSISEPDGGQNLQRKIRFHR